MIVVCYLLWKSAEKFTWTGLALAFILGGAVGNLYDRILFGRVTDFLHFYIGNHMWPDFNLADSAIVCGATLLCVDLIFGQKTAERGLKGSKLSHLSLHQQKVQSHQDQQKSVDPQDNRGSEDGNEPS